MPAVTHKTTKSGDDPKASRLAEAVVTRLPQCAFMSLTEIMRRTDCSYRVATIAKRFAREDYRRQKHTAEDLAFVDEGARLLRRLAAANTRYPGLLIRMTTPLGSENHSQLAKNYKMSRQYLHQINKQAGALASMLGVSIKVVLSGVSRGENRYTADGWLAKKLSE